MLRRILTIGALAAALVAPAALTTPADAATSSASSCYKRTGSHWHCITPGAYCPAAAHGKYGYRSSTHANHTSRYKCVKYSNGRWRWKRG